MKNLFWVFAFLSSFIHAQIQNPIKWTAELKHIKDNKFDVFFNGKLDKNWHIYSKDIKIENAVPTNIIFKQNPEIKLVGEIKEFGKRHSEYSDVFEGTMIYMSGDIQYIQRIELKRNKTSILEAEVEYQICDDEICLSPEIEIFRIKISPTQGKNGKIMENAVITAPSEEFTNKENIPNIFGEKSEILKISKDDLIFSSLDINSPINKECGEKGVEDESYLWIFIFGFIGGLVALLTPCVYPMIPLTISYFTKNSDTEKKGKRNALIYAFFIFLIFVLFTIPFHLIRGINPDIFNQISTNAWLNFFFFIIFIVFAFSFFGFYDITLPGWMANKSDKASESGGFIGLFFMALTLVIVSFSCTGPVLGTILANAIKNPTQLSMAFAGCGASWAIVFGGFALFPKFLKEMPKSGGWMNTLKVVLGFIELTLAFKFLSKADLVSKTHLINREIFIGIWLIITLLTVIYLLGFIKFPHDNKNQKIGIGRKIWAGIFLVFAVYLTTGLFPSKEPNLKLLSGLTPPLTHSFYNINNESCPLGLNCIHDYHKALEYAKKVNKPVLIDFTGYGCENCRKMEEYVWSDNEVLKTLENDIVLVSLYIDDSDELPKEEQKTITLKDGRQRTLKTIGNKWSTFQRENFNSNSQPQYIMVTPDNRVLNYPIAGYMDKDKFLEFLKCGIQTYKNIDKK